MSTSSNPTMASKSPMTQMIAHVSLKNAQAASMIVPPIYLITKLILRKGSKPFTIRRLMNVSTAAVGVGALSGVAMGYGRLNSEPEVALVDRITRMAHNTTQIRADDYSVIGATISALLVPAILLKRAPIINLVLGGASIGLGAGVWTHLAKSFTEGRDVKPEGMVGELPVVGGNGK